MIKMRNPLHFEESASSRKRWFRGWYPGSPLRHLVDDIPRLDDGQRDLVRLRLVEKISPESRKRAIGLLSVMRKDDRLVFDQVPGIHDVTAIPQLDEDAFGNFAKILEKGFKGGPYCNVFVVQPPVRQRFSQCGYKGRPESQREAKKTVTSEHEHFFGDRYRLLLWAGFSDNFAYLPDKAASYATVRQAHPIHIEPFVVFDSAVIDAEAMHQKIQTYRKLFGRDLLRFVDRGNDWQAVETD